MKIITTVKNFPKVKRQRKSRWQTNDLISANFHFLPPFQDALEIFSPLALALSRSILLFLYIHHPNLNVCSTLTTKYLVSKHMNLRLVYCILRRSAYCHTIPNQQFRFVNFVIIIVIIVDELFPTHKQHHHHLISNILEQDRIVAR